MIKIIVILVLFFSTLFSLTNNEVAKKSEDVMSGFEDSIAIMQMKLTNANGQKKVRTMKMSVLEGEVENKSLIEFLTPADVKGTKFLNYEHIDKDDDQWLYLPALKRVKRIASKNKSGSFMGSEFSYEDLSAFNIGKFIYEGEAKEVLLDGESVYEVYATPKSKNSGYTKQIFWIAKKNFLIKKVEYYDRKKKLLKVAHFSDYKKISGLYRIGSIFMKNMKNAKSTTLIWSDEKIKNGLSKKDFSKRYLKR